MKKALFLDRDGVINHDIGYAYKAEDIRFVDGIFELCQQAQQLGYLIIIVTNQSGIARGYYSEEEFATLNQWLVEQFTIHGIVIDAIYHCPHHPSITGDCECRKPHAGMLLQAIDKFKIDPTHSMMIGDKASDMLAAQTAAVPLRLLFTQDEPENNVHTAHIYSLTEALEFL